MTKARADLDISCLTVLGSGETRKVPQGSSGRGRKPDRPQQPDQQMAPADTTVQGKARAKVSKAPYS
ncbi:GL27368 [Drosophila persimilis]|uniref:GL27368 n=1 Tax=Drosophila persimilis TaxID=7234 RepID=B4HCM8_DROPE|nr:GL27368 [Drosophila persimilis]